MPLKLNQILRERYQIHSLLGQGGFGAVYRAMDLNLNRWCAVKENLSSSVTAQRQFEREAQILTRVRHQNLPQIWDYFVESGGQQYLVMEFVQGVDLSQLVHQRGVLTDAQAVALALHVLDALEYLHAQTPPIIHRDVKPDNILLISHGRVMLVDLGIAKQLTGSNSTPSGARGGSPGYAPLEQLSSGGTDLRADLYALGATLYFALTGHPPPDAVDRAMGTELPSPRQMNPAISTQLERAVLYAMEMTPADRPQSAAEMRRALAGNVPPRKSAPARASAAPVLGRVGQIGLAAGIGAQLIAGLATLILVLLAVLITIGFVLYAMSVLTRATGAP
ncbi:MAG: serine/threonine-protein kinase [Chloroflexota bacterium]